MLNKYDLDALSLPRILRDTELLSSLRGRGLHFPSGSGPQARARAEGVLLCLGPCSGSAVYFGGWSGCSLLVSAACSKKGPADHVRNAQGFEAKKDFANAMLEYRAALQADPKLGEARLKLGDLYAQLGTPRTPTANMSARPTRCRTAPTAQLKAGALLLLGQPIR